MFETKVLFPLTRVATLLSVLAVCAVIGFLVWPEKSAINLDYAAIEKSLLPSETMKKERVIVLPDDLKAHLNESNTEIVSGWVKGIAEEDREEFTDNLITIFNAAEKDPRIDKFDAVNKYRESVDKSLNHPSDTFGTAIKSATVGVSLIILLLLSNLLVSLAIERNTRKEK